MKKILFSLILLIICSALTAQKAEPVYSFVREHKTLPWYKEQVKAWKKVIDENPKNGLAWYYYYYATRNILKTDPADKRSFEDKDQVLKDLVAEMGKAIPDSYEYNLCMWKNHGFDLTYRKYIDRAMELGPDRVEHLDYIMNIGEMNRDLKMRDEGAIKTINAGLASAGMMYYNRNVLAGLDENAILITAGDNDTYPVWFLQAKGYRKDVLVINTSLILVDEYRKKLFKELGIENFEIKWAQNDTVKGSLADFNKKLVKILASNTKGRPVYVGLTAIGQKQVIEPVEDQLYLTGLAYSYCENQVDEKALLKKNFEQNFTLDYIEHRFYQDMSDELVSMVNQNYIVPMIKLYDHYKLAGEATNMAWIKRLLLVVSKGTPSEKEILNHVN